MSDPSTSTESGRDFNRLFPQRQPSRSGNSRKDGEDSSGSNSPISCPSTVLREKLSSVARFSLVDLLASILRLDFWYEEADRSFCSATLDLVLKTVGLPERTNATVRHHLKGEGATDDIAAYIMAIKKDPYIVKKGAIVIPSSLLSVFIESGSYDCRSRVLLRHVCALLAVRWDDFEDVEDAFVDMILGQEYTETEEARVARTRNTRLKKFKRYAIIGAACGVGGVLVGVTGGLAAPLVAAGAGVIVGGGVTAGIASTAGAAILGSIFGAAGAGLTGYKMKKRVGAIEEFTIQTLDDGRSLHCVLAVSGWIEDESENVFLHQWRHLWMSREQYVLRYESRYLAELGRAIDYLMSIAVSVAVQQTLLETAFAGLMTAIAWPVALLSAASVLDNPWNVCVARAAEVGEQLAEVLLSRAHGKRPITLIGFSMGARVIYHCLITMSKRASYAGIVNDVVLLGAPVSASPSQWQQINRVVGGRIINGYCNSDWLLRFIYRTMSVQFTIAGTGPVQCKGRKIVNFNLSHIVKGHMDYSRKLTEILAAVGVRVTPHREESMVNFSEVAKDDDAKSPDDDSERGSDSASSRLEAGSDGLDVTKKAIQKNSLADTEVASGVVEEMPAKKAASSEPDLAGGVCSPSDTKKSRLSRVHSE